MKVPVVLNDNVVAMSTRDVLRYLKDGKQVEIQKDPSIGMVNGGNTFFSKKGKDQYEVFSEGQNWRDQKSEERTLKQVYDHLTSARKEGYCDHYDEKCTAIIIRKSAGD